MATKKEIDKMREQMIERLSSYHISDSQVEDMWAALWANTQQHRILVTFKGAPKPD